VRRLQVRYLVTLLLAATNLGGQDCAEVAQARSSARRLYCRASQGPRRRSSQPFDRVTSTGWGTASAQPTDERLRRLQQGGEDPHFITTLFQFGRYLLIASSRPGDLPANLQGLWAQGMSPPWNSDYHLNINLQMNYWLAEPASWRNVPRPVQLIERSANQG
jgi:alpha-L-fucosidase 2